MMYLTCSRLTYAGSAIVPVSSISHRHLLRVKIEMDLESCKSPFEGWEKPASVAFNSIFLSGKSGIKFVEANKKALDLGYFDLPTDGGWNYGFYIDVPLTPEIRRLILQKPR